MPDNTAPAVAAAPRQINVFQSYLRQAIVKQPDRLRIGSRAAVGQFENLHEVDAIQQLIIERVLSLSGCRVVAAQGT